MQLYQFEEKLKRMRDQGADDYTEVAIESSHGKYYISKFVKEVRVDIDGGNIGRRIINIKD